MKRKLMALMLAGIMVIQSAGTSWAAEFTDGVNVEYGDSSENGNEEAFSDEQTEAENFEDDSSEKDLTEEAEVPAMASSDTSGKNVKVSFDNGTLTISGNGEVGQPLVRNCVHSLSEIKEVIIKNGVTNIKDSTFSDCIGLCSIKIPNSITNIGSLAFNNCSNLNNIEIPNSVTTIGYYAFSGCNSLQNIEIPDSVTTIKDDAFYGCSNLQSIKISNNITSIGICTFYGCSSLQTIKIPNNVISIDVSAFSKCRNLQSIEIPNSVISIGREAFYGCSSLKKVKISNNVTNIEFRMFYGCSSLQSIEIPNSVTSIGSEVFYGCNSLQSVKIPNSVTTIGYYAFYGCSSLQSIEIPNSIMLIGADAFENSSLSDIYYKGSKTQWEKITIGLGNEQLSKVIVHYYNIISTNQKFDLNIETPVVLGNQNSISVDFEASTPGNVANEEKAITWKSSNPAIAEIDKNTTGLIDSVDGNSAFGWINLLTYDVGEVTITGTTQDDRTASIKFNVEPKIDIKNHSINIWGKKSISICSVTLEKANKNYLQSYLESLKLETTGTSVKIENTTIKISDDGKSAELVGVLQPNATGETLITLSSPNGQKETINVNVTNGKITIQDYDYSKDLDRWMNDQGTANSMAYLSKEENFVNSVMVANYDSSFLDEFIENTTNLVYGGVEGWKNYWNNATKTEQAREILVALLTSYEGKVEELSMIETANKFTDIYISTLKNSNWAYAVAYGLDSSEINKLANLCSNEHLSEFFMSGKYEYLSHYLQRVGGYSEDSKIIKCIESFSKSKEYAESLSSGIKVMGIGVDILSVTDSTANKYFNLVTLENANEIYCDMLAYLKENCTYEPIKQAATDLYNIIEGDSIAQIKYLSKALTDKLVEKAINEALDEATQNVSLPAIVYKSYKYSKDIANIVFDTYDAQKQKDNMRCAAYIGAYLSRWMQYNKNMYTKSSGENKKLYAKKTVFAYYMLLKTRIAGEKSGREFMDLTKFKSGSRQYKVSLEITSTLEAMEALLKEKGVLGNKYASSTIACPVDVEVCDKSGRTILTVYDGKESSGNVNGIYYNVYYHVLDQDYVKVINFPEESGYILRCKANDMGKVEFSISTISANGNDVRRETTEIPVQKGNQIEIANISKDNPICKLIDNKGTVKQEYTVQQESNQDIPVTDLNADTNLMNIKVGEKALVNVKVFPENATIKTILWTSSNESVVKINSDGVIEGITAGSAKIKATSAKNDKIYVEISINVSQNTNVPVIPTPTVSPDKKPSVPKLSKITTSYNSITVKWNTVSDADGYQVYRKVNSGKWKVVKNTTGTSYKDKNVKAGYKYSYTVKAYKKVNGKKVYSGYNKKGLSGKLNTVVSLSVKNKTVFISWKKTTGATGYYIYRSGSKNGKFSKIKTITSGKTLKYTDKKVKTGNTYYYKVIPFAKITGKKVNSTSSIIKCISLKKKTPSSNTGTYPAEVQKLITYLKTNGDKWSGGGDNYERTWKISANERVTFQYQSPHDDQKSAVWMAYIITDSNNAAKDETIRISWEGHIFEDLSQTRRISVTYNIEGNDNYIGGDIPFDYSGKEDTTHFTNSSEISFNLYTNKSYTLNQLSAQGNKKLHKALPLFNTYLKQLMGISMSDMGFVDYKF